MNHGHALVMLDTLHEPDRILGDLADILKHPARRLATVVTRLVAVLGLELLAKVVEDLAAAAVCLVHAVLHHPPDVGLVGILLLARAVALVDQAVDQVGVAIGEEEEAVRRLAVAAGTASFLYPATRRPVSSCCNRGPTSIEILTW